MPFLIRAFESAFLPSGNELVAPGGIPDVLNSPQPSRFAAVK